MVWRRDKYTHAIERLTKGWSDFYRKTAQEVIETIGDLLDKGMRIDQAINQAMVQNSFFQRNRDALDEVLIKAAAAGYGLNVSTVKTSQRTAIIDKINTMPWAPDNMSLSARLHGTEGIIKTQVSNIIRQASVQGTNWVTLARQLYDGYNNPVGILSRAGLTPSLDDLLKASKRITWSDPNTIREYTLAIKKVLALTEKMAQGNAPNKALRAAYEKLVKMAEEGGAESLKNAIHSAMEERSRYFAERIARTEIARAWADGFYAKTYYDNDVIAYRWRLSGNHPKVDICDFHAYANLYGLGPGVYPKNSMPKQPAHPHCTCHLEEVFAGELDDLNMTLGADGMYRATFDPVAGQAWLKQQTEAHKKELLGAAGLAAFRDGGNWQEHLINWDGHRDPRPRLSPKDFLGETRITRDNSFFDDRKLLEYALNKDHSGDGKNKAIAFEKALGYTKDNYRELKEQVLNNLGEYPEEFKGENQYGKKYQVSMVITGPNGKQAKVLTGWLYTKNGDARLVTIHVDD